MKYVNIVHLLRNFGYFWPLTSKSPLSSRETVNGRVCDSNNCLHFAKSSAIVFSLSVACCSCVIDPKSS